MQTAKKTVMREATKDEAKLVQPDIMNNPIEKAIKKAVPEKVVLEDMPLNSLGDYIRYNKEASRLNKLAKRRDKTLKEGIYPIKQCPIELHPKDRIVFGRKDQPMNPLPVLLSNNMIHFQQTLIPGKTYDLPRVIIEYLASKGTPQWRWFDNPDGSRETRIAALDPRFSLRTIYKD